jgi:hypothetical protein
MVKRKMSRVNFKVNAVIEHKTSKYKCCVKDISLNGLYLFSDINLKIGNIVKIIVKMESETTAGEIVLKCETVRKEKDGIGFQFVELPLDSYIFLRNLVAYNYGDFSQIDDEYCRHLASRKMKDPEK